MQNRTYYQILNLPPTASDIDIKKAYRQAALKFHPDHATLPKDAATKKMQELNEAYSVLSDPVKKAAYDKKMQSNLIRAAEKTPLSQSSVTFYSSYNMERAFQIHMPTVAFFTNKTNHDPNNSVVNVVLLGSGAASKTVFVDNLSDQFTFLSTTLGVDFKEFKPADDLRFYIFDMAGKENFITLNSYIHQADVVLIFDDAYKYIMQCRTSFGQHLENCQIASIDYEKGQCLLGEMTHPDTFTLETLSAEPNMQSYDAYTAHVLGKSLFVNLENTLKAALQFTYGAVALEEQESFSRRPGCA